MTVRKTSKRDKENRPTEIINSALKLFEKKGFESTTFSDIAKDCNIARSTIYLYFTDKNDLLEKAMIARISEETNTFFEGKIKKGNSKIELFQNVLEKVFLTVDHERDDPFYVLITNLACKNKKVAQIMRKQVIEKILGTWHTLCKEANFTEEEEKIYAYLIFSLHLTSQFLNVIYKNDSPFIQLPEFLRLSREQLKKDLHIKNDT